MQNEIMLNKMYVGEYISNEFDNIGHEFINLFQADNGKYYIYAMPYGNISNKHDNKIKTILLVRNCGKHTLEILAKAEGLTQLTKIKNSWKKERTSIHQEQTQYIKDNHITYGGIELYKILKDNINNERAILYTFEAEKITKPKTQIYITVNAKETKNINRNDKIICLEDSNFSKSSLKWYITEEEHPKSYKELEDCINDAKLWEMESVKNFTPQKINNEFNFISILGKEYDELAFSNMFKYFFSVDKKLFCTFAKEILNIENFDETYKIEREKGHIDLLIQDKNNVIVIENKIKSGINGEKYDIYGKMISDQLRDYYWYVKGAKASKNNYVFYKKLTEQYADKNAFFYIFAPDYNHISEKRLEETVLLGCVKYKVINYSQIHDFYERHKKDYANKIPYYNEFLYALEKHSHSVDNNLEKEMYRRLNRVIQNKKGK